MKRILIILSVLAVAACLTVLAAQAAPVNTDADRMATHEAYRKVIADTAAMVSDRTAQRLAAKHGLQILNVTWEDTGRFKNSAVGPNISDMTIQIQQMDPRTEKFRLACMPVIRFPNFSDKTGDVSPGKFYLLVGNQKGKGLTRVSLKDFLSDIRKYLTKPDSWKGKRTSLLAKRDTHVLVSAQACFLPVPKKGIATFNPVLFNYQSYRGDPAVLTILATREGTSVTVIDNTRDGFQAGRTWGQRLFFNAKGQRASLTGKRLSDHLAEHRPDGQAGANTDPVRAAGQEGLNMVLLIQVPLKQKRPRHRISFPEAKSLAGPALSLRRNRDVEAAVVGHGKVEGPFTEIDNLEIERDPKFPIRVTVQFYKATSNGVVSEKDLSEIAAQIRKVYREAEYVGSLVTEGDTGRPTEHGGPKFEPPGWWDDFWRRHQENTGQTRAETLRMLRKLYGPNWTPPRTERELRAAIARARKAGTE